jgi:hypothetical protein
MAINIIIDDKVTFKVDGTETDAKGVARPFDFSLTALRLDTEALEAKQAAQGDQTMIDFILEVTEDWTGPRDQSGAPVPFSTEALRQLLKRPALAPLCFRRYMLAVAVQGKEKNLPR